jgi:hypothetical protein
VSQLCGDCWAVWSPELGCTAVWCSLTGCPCKALVRLFVCLFCLRTVRLQLLHREQECRSQCAHQALAHRQTAGALACVCRRPALLSIRQGAVVSGRALPLSLFVVMVVVVGTLCTVLWLCMLGWCVLPGRHASCTCICLLAHPWQPCFRRQCRGSSPVLAAGMWHTGVRGLACIARQVSVPGRCVSHPWWCGRCERLVGCQSQLQCTAAAVVWGGWRALGLRGLAVA